MKFIILSGGSGKRLWPLSNNTRSKQFLKLIPNLFGENESMIQRIYRQLSFCGVNKKDIFISTTNDQFDSIKRQIGNDTQVVLEPSQRNTYPAILLSCAYLYYELKIPMNEGIVVLPVDPYTDSKYFELITQIAKYVSEKSSTYDLLLMGIKPTYPSEKYGYIQYNLLENENIGEVLRFIEKPSKEMATELIDHGSLWNGGVFGFKLKYVIDLLSHYPKYSSYKDILHRYDELERTSFDYKVLEKAKSIGVLNYTGKWKDLGTWNTLTEHMTDTIIGNAISGENCNNTNIINELELPVIALGVENLVIVSNYDGILVSTKDASSYLKPYVEMLDNNRPMYEERTWGVYKIIDFHRINELMSLTKHISIDDGKQIVDQHHKHRKEIITIIEGHGEIKINNHLKRFNTGDVFVIEKGVKHSITAYSKVHIIETQIGTELDENDFVVS